MDIDNYSNIGDQLPCTILYVLLILDCLNSVGITELNIIVNIFISVWRRKNDPIPENAPVLLFRLVWKFQKTKQQVNKKLRVKALNRKFYFVQKSLFNIQRRAFVHLKFLSPYYIIVLQLKRTR